MSEMLLNSIVVGETIANFRKHKGTVLSGLSNISRTHLSAIECGGRRPTLETLYRISLALDVKMSGIMIAIEEEIDKG